MARWIAPFIFMFLVSLNVFMLIGCGGGGGGSSPVGGGGSCVPLPNVRLTGVTFSPANPTVGQVVNATVDGSYTNVAADTTVTVVVTRRENNTVFATLSVLLKAEAGSFTAPFAFTAESPESFYITADSTNLLIESDENDNNLPNVDVNATSTVASPTKDDFTITQVTPVIWIARLRNVDGHFGLPINGNTITLNADVPANLNYQTGAGMKLTIDAARGVEWAIDTGSLGNFRFGLKTKQANGADMFLLTSTLEGNPFLKNVDGLAERNLSYRVISSPSVSPRLVIPVPGPSVEIRPHAVGLDPNGVQTTIDPIDTDLYVDTFRIYIESINAHLTQPQGTGLGVMYRWDPSPSDLTLSAGSSLFGSYDSSRDQASVSLSGVSTTSAHTLLIGAIVHTGMPVLLNTNSFGFKGSASDPIPTHSLVDPATKLIQIRWDNIRRRWVSNRLVGISYFDGTKHWFHFSTDGMPRSTGEYLWYVNERQVGAYAISSGVPLAFINDKIPPYGVTIRLFGHGDPASFEVLDGQTISVRADWSTNPGAVRLQGVPYNPVPATDIGGGPYMLYSDTASKTVQAGVLTGSNTIRFDTPSVPTRVTVNSVDLHRRADGSYGFYIDEHGLIELP